jgi:hypothetical protein
MKNPLEPSRTPPLELPLPLKLFLLTSVVLTIVSFTYCIVCRHLGLGLPYSFPYYYVPDDMFQDLYVLQAKIETYGTPEFFTNKQGYFMYPAPLVHVFRLFLNIPGHTMRRYLIVAGVSTLFLCAMLIRALRKNRISTGYAMLFVFSTALLSYPLLFLLQRWNVEVLVWLLTSLGIWQFFSGRPNISATFIGVAAALKLYPFVLLGLFLPRRQYRAFALSILVFFTVVLASLYAIGPSIGAALAWNSAQMREFTEQFAGKFWGLGYDHSLFALVKFFTLPWHPNVDPWVRPYTITAALLSVALYFLRIWRLPLFNQILALSVLNVMLAPVSFDYTLLNLYPAFGILAVILTQVEQGVTPAIPYAKVYLILFALIFTPESYIIIHGIRYAAQFRALCLIGVLVLALRTPIYHHTLPNPTTSREQTAMIAGD